MDKVSGIVNMNNTNSFYLFLVNKMNFYSSPMNHFICFSIPEFEKWNINSLNSNEVKVIGTKKNLYLCQMGYLYEKSSIKKAFFSKHGRKNRLRIIWFILIRLIFIFKVILRWFQSFMWFFKIYKVFLRCSKKKKAKIRYFFLLKNMNFILINCVCMKFVYK